MSKPKLYVFHPSPYMVEEIDSLLSDMSPELTYENIILPKLLDEAMKVGITEEMTKVVREAILNIPDKKKAIILCSCSTFGECVEKMQECTNNSIIRIDRPMVELAIEHGSKIGLAAALKSTLAPTRLLLESIAKANNKEIVIKEILCEKAWGYRQKNDKEGYINEIASSLRKESKELDVVVLAQGSMAPASNLLEDLNISILSSPVPAVKRIIEMCNNVVV